MEEELEPEFEEDEILPGYEESITHSTACDHFYVDTPEQDPNSTLVSAVCIHCWSGISYDPSYFSLEDGKMVGKEP